jgi:hypothetical protein
VAVWPVVVSEWQHECCGEAFAVGDEVCWKLAVLDAGHSVGLRDELVTIAGHVIRVAHTGQGDPTAVVELDLGGVVDWSGAERVGTRVEVRGLLAQEHHGGVPDDLPATRGVVRRIRVITRPYGASGEPLAAPAELREVARSPRTWNRSEGAPTWVEDGMLVELNAGSCQ